MKNSNIFLLCTLLGIFSIMQAPDGIEGYQAGERGIGIGEHFVSTEGLSDSEHRSMIKTYGERYFTRRSETKSESSDNALELRNLFRKGRQSSSSGVSADTQSFQITPLFSESPIKAEIKRQLGLQSASIDGNTNQQISDLVDKLEKAGVDPKTEYGKERIERALLRHKDLQQKLFEQKAQDIFEQTILPNLKAQGVSEKHIQTLSQELPKIIAQAVSDTEAFRETYVMNERVLKIQDLDFSTNVYMQKLIESVKSAMKRNSAFEEVLRDPKVTAALNESFEKIPKWIRTSAKVVGVGLAVSGIVAIIAAFGLMTYIVFTPPTMHQYAAHKHAAKGLKASKS